MLGPVEARLGGEPVDLGTPRQRAIVAALALSGGRTVPVDTVIARVWADRRAVGSLATLHGYVAACAARSNRIEHRAPSHGSW